MLAVNFAGYIRTRGSNTLCTLFSTQRNWSRLHVLFCKKANPAAGFFQRRSEVI